MSDPLFVFLVSGNPAGGDDGFARCAWLRVAELTAQFYKNRKKSDSPIQEDSVLRFIHFDCHTATVGIYEHDFAKQRGAVRDPGAVAKSVQRHWKTLDDSFQTAHGTLSQQNDPKTFVEWKQIREAKANVITRNHALSIVNVYHSVRKAPSGSLLELSIFSHAFVDGPVLFNTAGSSGSIRDQNDTDGRRSSDFQTNMGESGAANANALGEFRGRFASTGSFRIWGCNIQDVVDTFPPEDEFDVNDIDVANADPLIAKLQSDTDPSTAPVSQFIWAAFTPATKQLLSDSSKTPEERQNGLIKALNKILKGSSIFKPSRFSSVTLRLETRSLVTQNPTGDHLISFNRLLLEDTYPSQIAKNPKAPRCLIMSTVLQVIVAAFTRHLNKGDPLANVLRDAKKLPPPGTMIQLDMDAQFDDEISAQKDRRAGHAYSHFVKFRLFEIRYDETFKNHAYKSFFQGERDSSGNFAKTIARSLSDVVKFVAAETIETYTFAAAEALKTVTVFGGAPGTSADVDPGVQQKINPKHFDKARFYSQFLGVSTTEDGAAVQRRYAVFDNKGVAVKSIRDKAVRGLSPP